ncbi:PIN domain-containing protein [Methylomagnum sp.]
MSAEFIDSNVVIYSVDKDAVKRRKALAILKRQPVISVQVMNETANTLRRKLGFEIPQIQQILTKLIQQCRLYPLAPSTVFSALKLAERYGFSHYDCVIVAAALEAGCDTLYSEDMQDGQVIEGRLRVVNPFR